MVDLKESRVPLDERLRAVDRLAKRLGRRLEHLVEVDFVDLADAEDDVVSVVVAHVPNLPLKAL